ncbi:hypothetical protein ACFSBG_13845 [Georgenia yuyongxinii]|uniref:hypothetical protein n=1 Tax=Georgenia yuyongxinii TaxID=2589797 RepID=UPI00143DA922|nr:hypothetical protein [Georgenia yuyongxinii]
MDVTPADLAARSVPAGDPLARLDDLEEIPLAEQVAVFETIHSHLSARLANAES